MAAPAERVPAGPEEDLGSSSGSTAACHRPVAPEPEPPARDPFVMRWLTTLTIIGVVVGVGAAVLAQSLNASSAVVKVLGWPGQLFVRALKALVVPMIFSSMVMSTSAMGTRGSAGAMSRMAVKFYLLTTFIAAFEGIALFNVFRPAFSSGEERADAPAGAAANSTSAGSSSGSSSGGGLLLDTVLDFGFDLVPDNLAKALLDTQLLGIITFAVFFGAMLPASAAGRQMAELFGTCFDTCVAMIRIVIFFTPLGVGSLVAGALAREDDVVSVFGSLGALLGVVVLGQCLHVFGAYAALYAGLTRKNPLRFFAGLPSMWMTAFGTSSSAATLSTTIRCCAELGVSREAINFVLPIGCTINMDGSALERPIVVMWIAYMAGHPIPLGRQLVVALTSALLSIGGSPIPSGGVSTLVVMVEAARVPMTPAVEMYIALCLAVEWLLDRVRTCVNVTGDAVGVAIIDQLLPASSPQGGTEKEPAGDAAAAGSAV